MRVNVRIVLPILSLIALFIGYQNFSSQALSTEPVVISGLVEESVEDDFKNGKASYHHVIHDLQTGEAVELEAGKFRDKLRTGKRMKLRGARRLDRKGKVEIEELTEIESANTSMAAAAIKETHSIIVIPVNFQDATVDYTATDIERDMFGPTNSVNDVYRDATFGKIEFLKDTNGDGFPDIFPVTIPYSATNRCDYSIWRTVAEAALEKNGIDLSIYQHKMFILPTNTNCPWLGLATVGCSQGCTSYIIRPGLQTMTHELGHNLGLMHAGRDSADDGINELEYGDNSCPMGNPNAPPRFNAPHFYQPGWLNEAFPTAVQDVTFSGNFKIATLGSANLPDLPQVLKIKKPNTEFDYYFLSYRQRIGYDGLDLPEPYVIGVSLHRHTIQPGGVFATSLIQIMKNGTPFTDATGQVSVDQVSLNSDGSANLAVTLKVVPTPTPTPVPTATPRPTPMPCAIKVESPNVGLRLKRGSTFSVVWTGARGTHVGIHLLRTTSTGSIVKATLFAKTANDTIQPWKISTNLPASKKYKIRVCEVEDGSCRDQSDAFFELY